MEEYIDAPSQEIEVETPTENIETPTIETPIEQPKIKVKYNHEEVEIPYEEAVTHIQKGMNYEKAIERERQSARDSYIADQGYEWNGKPITTEAEYKQALVEKELYDKYEEQGLPEEVITELVESKKFREAYNSDQTTKTEQMKKETEYKEFLDYFKSENNRDYDTVKDTIPKEVWELVTKGKTLVDAYAINEAKQLRTKLRALETNQANAEATPGSITGNGKADLPLTEEMIENMPQSELMKRWKEVKQVLKMK